MEIARAARRATEQPANQSADNAPSNAEQLRHQTAHLVAARHQQARQRANDQPDDQPADDLAYHLLIPQFSNRCRALGLDEAVSRARRVALVQARIDLSGRAVKLSTCSIAGALDVVAAGGLADHV